jgi:hypothetical protein
MEYVNGRRRFGVGSLHGQVELRGSKRIDAYMTSRDPRIDPQPGDELRAGFAVRRVIERDGERVLVEKWGHHYWIRLKTWQQWCEQMGTEVVATAEGEQ